MAFISVTRLRQAIDDLRPFHAFYGVTYLSMKQTGVVKEPPVKWGSPQEEELLRNHYTAPCAPPGSPYCVPFNSKKGTKPGMWKRPKFSSGVLQRARTTDNFSDAFEHEPSSPDWSFTDDYLDVLTANLPKEGGVPKRIPAVSLAAWLFRNEEVESDVSAILARLREHFKLEDDAEFERLFDADTTEDPRRVFAAEPIPPEELVELLEGVPEGPKLGDRSEADLLAHLEQHIRSTGNLELPTGFVERFYTALKTQRFVVLAGRPGTGKTAFARAFSAALEEFFRASVGLTLLSIGQDYSESDAIGYEKLAGDFAASPLSQALFLDERPRDVHIVVLDEMNLADVDYYLARLLPAVESDLPVQLPGRSGLERLPSDAFFIGTVNSYLEESTRRPLSGPVKRRANILQMPNLLDAIVQSGDRTRFASTCRLLLKQGLDNSESRARSDVASVIDSLRVSELKAALEPGSPLLSESFLEALWSIVECCAADVGTSLTLGVLQDVIEYIALSPARPVFAALDDQIAQKVVPQLSGPAEIARRLRDVLEGLRTEESSFSLALAALDDLLGTEDAGSGLVFYRY